MKDFFEDIDRIMDGSKVVEIVAHSVFSRRKESIRGSPVRPKNSRNKKESKKDRRNG